MKLGEKIYVYRTRKNLSQGDLADLLDVSRQSVSKWETDASVPELEKLVRLCEIFEITLDHLVNGDPNAEGAPAETAERQASYAQIPPTKAVQTPDGYWRRIAGVILLCMGFLVFFLISILGDPRAGLVFASPFLLCGGICMIFRRHVGLWCAWAVYFCVSLYLSVSTGVIHWYTSFRIIQFIIRDGFTAVILISLALFAVRATLITVTVIRFKGRIVKINKPIVIFSIVGGVIYIFFRFFWPMIVLPEEPTYAVLLLLYWFARLLYWGNTVIVTLLLVTYVPHILVWWRRRKGQEIK